MSLVAEVRRREVVSQSSFSMAIRCWLSVMIVVVVRLSEANQPAGPAAAPATPAAPAAPAGPAGPPGPAAPTAAPVSVQAADPPQTCSTGGATAVSVVSRQNASGHWLGDAWVERPAPPGRPLGALTLHLIHERRRCGDASTVLMHLKLEGPPDPVRADYHLFAGHSYYKAHPEKVSWVEAKAICEVEGAHLLILNSQEEAEFFKKMIDPLGGVIYLGVHDMVSEGKFVTVFGDPLEETGYVKWRNNEPNGGRNENCLNIYASGEMNDLSCENMKFAFICESPLL